MPKLYPLKLSREIIKALRNGASIGDLHKLKCGVDTALGNIKFADNDSAVPEIAVFEVLWFHFSNGNIDAPRNKWWKKYIGGNLASDYESSEEEWQKRWDKAMKVKPIVLRKKVTHPTYFDI